VAQLLQGAIQNLEIAPGGIILRKFDHGAQDPRQLLVFAGTVARPQPLVYLGYDLR
jgi:hypothetical protein